MENRLKELRKEKGLSLNALRSILNEKYEFKVSSSQLMYYENGERLPRNQKIWECLADYFNVPLSFLMGYPAMDILGNAIPSDELQEYDYYVLDINQDTPETLNEVSRLKYSVIKLIKENEAPLFTGFRAIITDHDREIVIDPISLETLINAFGRTDVLIKHGYQSGSSEQFRDFDKYIGSRKREDKEILENVISNWLAILNIDKQHVNISYFDKAIATPNKLKLKK